MNIVKLKCTDFTTDWYRDKEIEIDIDQFIYFEIDYRGENSWHLIGHKYIEKSDKWQTVDFDYHMCTIHDIARFIAEVNNIPSESGRLINRVSKFKNLHYYTNFYKNLQNLLCLVEKYSKEKEK